MDNVVDDPVPWFMRLCRRVLHHHLEKSARSAKTLTALGFVGALTPAIASGQSVQDFIVDPAPPAGSLEKSIGYYVSTVLPSVVLGLSGDPEGMYLYGRRCIHQGRVALDLVRRLAERLVWDLIMDRALTLSPITSPARRLVLPSRGQGLGRGLRS